MIHEVPPNVTTLTLDGLIPNTEYELTIVALHYLPPSASRSSPSSRRDYSLDQMTLSPMTGPDRGHNHHPNKVPLESASEPIRFISPDTGKFKFNNNLFLIRFTNSDCQPFLEPGRFYRHSHKQLLLRKKDPNAPLKLKMDEVVIVVGVLIAWMSIIGLFIKKWGKIRAIEPCQSYFSPEIYDIPLNKSLGLIKRSVDMSAQTAMSQSLTVQHQQLILNSGLPMLAPGTSGAFDSRRSLSALVSNLRRDSNNCAGGYNLSSPPSIDVQSTGGHHQRQRVNSVFVTPPTRPVTPYDGTNNNIGNGDRERTSVVSIMGESPPRRFKSAEDLRSIVNEFTRRKSTLLMSPTYFIAKKE